MIRDTLIDALIGDGWNMTRGADDSYEFDKVIIGWAMGGAVVPDGRRRVVLTLDWIGRWFERRELGTMDQYEKSIDLRNYWKIGDNGDPILDVTGAIEAVLEKD